MKSLHWLLLFTIEKIHQERTLGGVYHLLSGKQSAQTIQDAYLFNLTPFVGILKGSNKENYFFTIKFLQNEHYIELKEDIVFLTGKGKSYLDELSDLYELPKYYHGGRYEWKRASNTFWDRLSLTIQSLSFLLVKERSFIPISYGLETQQWVKMFFKKSNYQYERISEQLYKELSHFLQDFANREKYLFIQRLTAYGQVGKTFDQLCQPYNNDPLFAKIYFQSILHRCMSTCFEEPELYPILAYLCQDLHEGKAVTASALETWRFVKQGKKLEEIAHIRRLKNSTIEDHLVELAIHHPDFSYSKYISHKDMEDVLSVARELKTKRLRLIRDSLSPHISYFQIRLALTMLHERINDDESAT